VSCRTRQAPLIWVTLCVVVGWQNVPAQSSAPAPAALQQGPDSHYERAVSAEQEGDYRSAIHELREAVHARPTDAKLHTALGVTFFHEGFLADAIQEFSAAIQLKPDDTDARSDLAAAWINLGDCDNAIPELEYLAAAEGDQETRNNLGLCYLQAGRWQDAAKQYRALLKADPESPELLYNLGVARKHEQDYNGAIASLRHALQIKPDFPAVAFELGQIYWEQGMLEDAAEHLQSLCRAHPDFLPAYFPLAEVLRQQGAADAALAAIQKALQAGPSAPAYQELGILEKARGNIDAAASAFHKAEELKSPAKIQQAALMAVVAAKGLLRVHDAQRARLKLEFAVKLDPTSAAAHLQLALALKQLHDDSGALVEFRKASGLDGRFKPPFEMTTVTNGASLPGAKP